MFQKYLRILPLHLLTNHSYFQDIRSKGSLFTLWTPTFDRIVLTASLTLGLARGTVHHPIIDPWQLAVPLNFKTLYSFPYRRAIASCSFLEPSTTVLLTAVFGAALTMLALWLDAAGLPWLRVQTASHILTQFPAQISRPFRITHALEWFKPVIYNKDCSHIFIERSAF